MQGEPEGSTLPGAACSVDSAASPGRESGGSAAARRSDTERSAGGAGGGAGGGADDGGGDERAALVERILCIFREGILPLRRECQLAYLLERLQGLHVAYLGKACTPFYRASKHSQALENQTTADSWTYSPFPDASPKLDSRRGWGLQGIVDLTLGWWLPAGPSGTYSHHAAITFFGNQGAQAEGPVAVGQWQEGRVAGFTALPERTVDAVFKTVVANQAQFGVVPIENSHTGISGKKLRFFDTF